MLGYPDGEGAPWEEMFAAAGRVARAVSVPVTVDAEAGYGMRPRELVDRLLDIGAVGCNLEDTDHRDGRPGRGRCARRLARRASAPPQTTPGSRSSSTPASTPSYPTGGIPERIGSRKRYDGAGSTGTPAPTASTRSACADHATSLTLVAELPGPVNGNTGEQLDLATLRELGVARVSFGPRFYRAAWPT